MTLQRRLKRIMTRKNWRVADLAREISRPYMTVREWVVNGRFPAEYRDVDRILRRFE
jgi:hypothetical protein